VNKQLDDAIARVRTLPDEQQREAARILLEFLDLQDSDMQLTPEQIAEIQRRLSDDEPYATSEEVRDLYARLTR
jgi:recombinational DNA repair protein RecR